MKLRNFFNGKIRDGKTDWRIGNIETIQQKQKEWNGAERGNGI